MADLVPVAAERHGDKPALRFKAGDAWQDVSYTELATIVSEVGRGLIDLGIEPGDKAAIVAHTRPEWSYAHFGILAAGAISVSVYQTNSAAECHYVLEHSEASVVFVENAEQLEKVRAVRNRLPELRHLVLLEPVEGADDAVTLEQLRERGRGHEASELQRRTAAVTKDDICIYIYTSGTTGPPKGCLLTHGNYRDVVSMSEAQGVLAEGEIAYLFLPLAHAFAKLVQFIVLDLGGVLAFWERDPQKIVPNLMEIRPTFFPSVPRVFEKIYTLATSNAEDPEQLRRAVDVGLELRQAELAGEEVPEALRTAFDQADEALFKNVRGLFGGRIEQCNTGAAPIAKEILEFFYACGVPVMEGYGMTETATVATVNTPRAFRLGSVGKPIPGVETRVASDGELLLRGANIFRGYYKDEQATEQTLVEGWLHTGDLGSIDADGFVFITGRKKDIIITAGGKNITPANLENGLKQTRWISQAIVVGDRRPFLVALITLDPDEAPAFAEQHGLSVEALPRSEAMRAEVQSVLDEVNSHVGPVEQVKYFKVLEHDLTQETGELTPTLKVKRNVVAEKYAAEIDALYQR
jgi:long-chain acyl-CoA synthetase